MPKKFPTETLTISEVQSLLAACSARCPTGIRNRALIVVLWRAGLRCAEALSLEPRDVTPESIHVRRGKGRKARKVAVDATAWAYIQSWLVAKKKHGIVGQVFSTLKSEPLQSAYVRNLFKRLGKKAKIDKRVHPHGLRHTFAAGLADEQVDVRIIQKALGHSSLNTTARYIDHLAPTAVLNALRFRTW
jgi:site-specific recombinase XerD